MNLDELDYFQKRIILSDIFGFDEGELTKDNIDFYQQIIFNILN